MAHSYPQLTDEQKSKVEAQVRDVVARMEQEPKSMGWKLRARVGDRVKWYKEVDEVG